MVQRFHDAQWRVNQMIGEIVHVKAGAYDQGHMITKEDYDCVIQENDIHSLVIFLDNCGYIRPLPNEQQSRSDDLKIIHRLLDIQVLSLGGKQDV